MLTPLLREAGHTVLDAADPATPADALMHVEAAITRGSVRIDHSVFERLPALRLLCCWGAGYEAVDLEAAARRGIQVANSPGANAASVADLAIGFLIALMRNLSAAEAHLRGGGWRDAARRLPPAPGLTGMRLGIFGFGEVGRRVAVRAQAFEMEVGCFTRTRRGMSGIRHFEDLPTLAGWADALVVAVNASDATFHAVDQHVLRALGPDGFLVNVARGNVVDEQALCRALDAGQLAGFGADVFEREPQVPEAMLRFPNAVLTPHVAGATRQAQVAMVAAVCANLDSFFRAGRAVHALRVGGGS